MDNKQRQHLLAYLGYYKMKVDGDWGSGSREACKAFQRDRELTADGYGGPETDKALRYAVYNGLDKPIPIENETDIYVGGKTSPTGTFWDHIRYWTREEFRCRCGGKYCNGFPAEPKETLVRIAGQLRKNLGVPITVISGLRCETWNSKIGRASV
jgi:peptidoglycan hydrolase-like protein with peptidoglycan-binding domain